MKKITNLKDKLIANCPYPRLWDEPNLDATGYPTCELGYFRCDHDDYMWHKTLWVAHDELQTPELVAEFYALFDAFRRAFKDRADMAKWCRKNATTSGWDYAEKYSAYYEGEYGRYWFHMNPRRGDYNLYLHCFSRAAM